jgi:hypothetical protein
VPGDIKSGRGPLIGNAGEYYVMAELLKRGVVAALAPRNAPDFDILATKDGKTVRIRVKTKSEAYDIWQWVIKKDGAVFRNVAVQGDFIVLVHLAKDVQNMQYFIARTQDVAAWLRQLMDDWLAKPGKYGPHDPESKKRHLSLSEFRDRLSTDWDMLWQ